MSQPRQRLLPIAGLPLALEPALRATRARLGSILRAAHARLGGSLRASWAAFGERLRPIIQRIQERLPERFRAQLDEPVQGALVKISEGGKALMTLPAKGRALVELMPEPVQLELRKLSTRSAHVCREVFAGILVVGLIAIVFGYGRLAHGPISLPSLVPSIENAINEQLTDLHVKIDDAILQRAPDGPGVLFRLRNIRLIDRDGSIVAQAPLAAIGMSGSALLRGRIAPGSVDFIGPKLLFYSSDDGLSLSFYRPTGPAAESLMRGSFVEDSAPGESTVAKRPEPQVETQPQPPTGTPAGRQLDVTRTITEVFERARSGSTSYLTRFGVKDAEVVLSQDGVQTMWQVPDFAIDLEHKGQRSILVGQANLNSSKGQWQLEVRTEELPKQDLAFTALIQDLVPSGLADTFPSVVALQALDLPVSGETSIEVTNTGKLISGETRLRVHAGDITPPWDRENPMRIDSGRLNARYSKKEGVIEIEPSKLTWGQSEATISGTFRRSEEDKRFWSFALRADEAVLAGEEAGLAPMKVDEWTAEGTVSPDTGILTLSRFVIRSGPAFIELAGKVTDAPESPEVHLAGTLSPMPLDVLKRFWPKFLAGPARKWVWQNVSGGEVLGGKFAVSLAPGELARVEKGGDLAPEAVRVDIDLDRMGLTYMEGMPPILTGPAKLQVSGITFAVDIPQAKIVLEDGKEIALTEGRFFIPDLRKDPQDGEVTFKAEATTATALELLDHEPLNYMRTVGLSPGDFGGTAQGSFALFMPMREDLEFKHIKLRGGARLNEAIAANVLGKLDVEGGGIDVNVTEEGIEATGDILVQGVPAQLSWRRIFYQPEERQPPITIAATLDEATREKLGLKLSHLVKGAVPTTLSVTRDSQGGQAVTMQADLTNARLVFGNMGWIKPAGRRATLALEVAPAPDGSTELKNFQILGDDIAINGSIALDPEQHLKSFYFSEFSVDNLTQIEITATVRDGSVLDVEAHGPAYNGKQFFQSLFSAGQIAEGAEPHDPFDVNLSARLGAVYGFYDTTLNDAQVTLRKRKGRLVALDATGRLNGKPVAVRLEGGSNARIIRAESQDAGSAFRLIGFYPKIDGGQASLEVNLDSAQPGMMTGTLWARNFAVLGDSVVSDVLSDPQSAAALGTRRRQVQQTRIAFNQLRAPFAVGNGEFILNDAYMNGPILGATMRGRVNFKNQTVNLGGTYVPLYGLNSALGAIPVLGGLLVGRQGEGIVGITFAIQGPLEDPNVLVNPMSVVAPGIFRQIFEFNAQGQNAAASPPAPSDFDTGFGR